MKKIFSVFLISVLMFCGCQSEEPDTLDAPRPMMFYENVYWKNPYMPVSELPEGYESAGTVPEEMAFNTGLEGIEFFTNEGSGDFYTYQETGTPIGGNMVDTEKRAMHYIRWVPIDSNE